MDARVAVITGGGRGIGRAVAGHLLGQGWAVLLAERDASAGEDALQALRGGERLLFVRTDVAREDEVQAAFDAALQRFGRLDLLVNNAAIARNQPLAELSLDDWQAVLAANLTGPFLCSKHAAPHLAASGGSIVNIASTRALMSEPDTEAYSASKGGLVALTHALAVSLGPRVRVNCISPGWIDTRAYQPAGVPAPPPLSAADHAQHPAGRVGRPEDVAALIAYLAGPEAAFMTGQNLVLDGGMTRRMVYVE